MLGEDVGLTGQRSYVGLPTVSSLTANVRLTYVQRTFNVHLYVKGMFRLRLGSAPDGSAPKTRWY